MLADAICDILAAGPMTAPEVTLRLRAAGHEVSDADVRRQLARLYGSRVARDGGCWRLLGASPAAGLAAMTATMGGIQRALDAKAAV